MELYLGNSESTWAKARVTPVTDSVVLTPVSKRQAVFYDALLTNINPTESVEVGSLTPQDSKLSYGVVNDIVVPAISRIRSVSEGALATVIQIWEGVVLSVDHAKAVMLVKLTDRGGLIPEHTASIELQWVADQDRDLLRVGAIFYWTIYKETKRGSVSNAQEIRFRRLPNWTTKKLKALEQDTQELSAKFSTASRRAD